MAVRRNVVQFRYAVRGHSCYSRCVMRCHNNLGHIWLLPSANRSVDKILRTVLMINLNDHPGANLTIPDFVARICHILFPKRASRKFALRASFPKIIMCTMLCTMSRIGLEAFSPQSELLKPASASLPRDVLENNNHNIWIRWIQMLQIGDLHLSGMCPNNTNLLSLIRKVYCTEL